MKKQLTITLLLGAIAILSLPLANATGVDINCTGACAGEGLEADSIRANVTNQLATDITTDIATDVATDVATGAVVSPPPPPPPPPMCPPVCPFP